MTIRLNFQFVSSSLSTSADPDAEAPSTKLKRTDLGGMRPLYLDAQVRETCDPFPIQFLLILTPQSTTPTDPRVLDAMLPYLTSSYGNPHSRTHAYGWESEDAMEEARAQIGR